MATQQSNFAKVAASKIDGEVYNVSIEGWLDWTNINKLEEAVQKIFAENCYKVVVDMSQVKYMSSMGFSTLISLVRDAVEHSGNIIFFSTPPHVMEIFEILGLHRVLTFAPDQATAIKEVKNPTTKPEL